MKYRWLTRSIWTIPILLKHSVVVRHDVAFASSLALIDFSLQSGKIGAANEVPLAPPPGVK